MTQNQYGHALAAGILSMVGGAALLLGGGLNGIFRGLEAGAAGESTATGILILIASLLLGAGAITGGILSRKAPQTSAMLMTAAAVFCIPLNPYSIVLLATAAVIQFRMVKSMQRQLVSA